MNGIGAAQLQHHLLEVAARDLGDRGARALRASQRDPAHARVGDDPLDLVIGGEDVDVGVLGDPGLVEDLLHRQRGLRALRRVLEQDRVTDHQVGPGETRHLVIRVVPRHDPQQQAVRAAAHERGPVPVQQLDRLIGHQRGTVVGVVVIDRTAEIDLAERLLDRLAHLAHDDLGKLLALLGMKLADSPDDSGALLYRRRPRPLAMRPVGTPDGVTKLVVADRRILAYRLARSRVDDCVIGH